MMTKNHLSQPIPLPGIDREKIMRDAPKDLGAGMFILASSTMGKYWVQNQENE